MGSLLACCHSSESDDSKDHTYSLMRDDAVESFNKPPSSSYSSEVSTAVQLSIVSLDLDVQSVELENDGLVPVNLKGWSVMDSIALSEARKMGDDFDLNALSSHKVFRFPELILSPGSRIIIYCGLDLAKTPVGKVSMPEEDEFGHAWCEHADFDQEVSVFYFYWLHAQVWQDLGDTAYLVDHKGRCVDEVTEEG